MTNEIALNTTPLSTPEEAHARREQIREAKLGINLRLLAIGKILEEGHIKQDWDALGYETETDWITDPHGIDMRMRTARAFRRIYRLWVNRLAKLSVTDKDLATIDHCKLEAMASKIENEPDDDKALELLERARTLTLRMIIDEHEEEKYITFSAHKCKAHRCLHEKSGQLVTFSQVFWSPDVSAQNFWDVCGNKIVDIRVRLKKE